MIDRLIEDERGRDRLLAFISRRALPFRASIVDGRPRSYDQNRLQWQWASEAASQLQDTTARELQLEWKARFAAPLLAEEQPRFAAVWALMERKLTYHERVQWVEFLDISSALSVKGFASFLDQIFRFYTEQGIELTDPQENQYGPKIGSRVDRGGTGPSDTAAGKAQGGEEPAGKVRGLYSGLQREVKTGDAPRTSTGGRRGEPGK